MNDVKHVKTNGFDLRPESPDECNLAHACDISPTFLLNFVQITPQIVPPFRDAQRPFLRALTRPAGICVCRGLNRDDDYCLMDSSVLGAL